MTISVSSAAETLKLSSSRALYEEILALFASAYPDAANIEFVRAPGRVNIIGEHTDYNGLPVFPMALDREIAIGIAPNLGSIVELGNVDTALPVVKFDLSGQIPPYETGHWGNYAKAAAQAIWEWTSANCSEKLPLCGFRGIVGGSIPPASGLSSSSALVVAIATALVYVNDLPISKPDLADLLAKGERYVGTEGGGMDQAASIMGEEGFAIKIDFFPLRTRAAKVPNGYSIVVANSLVSAKKTGGARLAYNSRVAECKLGLEMLKRNAKDTYPVVADAILLRDFMANVPDWSDYLIALPNQPISLSEVAAYVGESEEGLTSKCLTRRDGTILTPPAEGFNVKKRCRHVLTEADRVVRAAQAMDNGDAQALGTLMNESHVSCASDYEISCPELEVLVGLLRENGAVGARLTGAGFGGCTVALVKTSDAGKLMDAVWEAYYRTYLPEHGTAIPERREDVLFACTPSAGAGVVQFG